MQQHLGERITELENIFKSHVAITHFPAGEVSRFYNGKIQDREWRKSLVSRSVAHQRDLVPVFFYGKNSRLFYGINLVRRALGIKLNIELALLPHEMFNKKNKTLKVRIGKPIPYTTFTKQFSQQEWTAKVRNHVYNLEQNDTFSAYPQQKGTIYTCHMPEENQLELRLIY